CTSNGNDMDWNRNAVYFNSNGILETNASWRSADIGQFGHLYLGDVNNDRLMDMAVVFLGLGTTQGPVRIYQNNGIGFDSTPYWLSSDQYNSFDCAFGDIDLDGDLDLGVAAGDAYPPITLSPTRVYRNNNGVFEILPYWTSRDSTPSDACRLADLDNDGDLDLIVGYRRKIAVFKNYVDSLERNASWSVTNLGWILRLAVGDYDNDNWLDLAAAANGQLGDPNSIMVFHNQNGTLETTPTFTMLQNRHYSSCVAWADVNNDGYLDLAAGGWWEPVVVFENNSGVLDTISTWSYSAGSNLVCETVMWGCVDNDHLVVSNEQKTGDGTRKLFYLSHNPFQSFSGVTIDGNPVPASDYCFDPLTGWVSFQNAPDQGADIIFQYQYSNYPDLAVTNWVEPAGNHLFENTTTVAIADNLNQVENEFFEVSPNPFSKILEIKCKLKTGAKLAIFDASGRCVKTFTNSSKFLWNGQDEQGNLLPKGIYFLRFNQAPYSAKKIIKL
ncbi:MAG: T9SS type A sorting domain-containing protein, partial [bacterium]